MSRQRHRAPKPGLEFSVMSYNVLAQCLLEDNFHLYEHCDPRVLSWDYRRRRLLKEFIAADADVRLFLRRSDFKSDLKGNGFLI